VLVYLDASAAAKLVVDEAASGPLRTWLLDGGHRLTAGDLLTTELLRATRREAPDRLGQARQALRTVTLLPMGTATFQMAARLEPNGLRSLDALHLAVALSLGSDLDALVTYDQRLADAAAFHGIEVLAPS
jgi:predicted nucleic acid-binding protein